MREPFASLLAIVMTVLTCLLCVWLDHTIPVRERVIEEKVLVPVDTLSDWQVLEMAIAFTESRFKKDAIGKAEDTGVLQIRPVYVDEVNRLSGRDYTIEDALDPCMSLEMFNLMQEHKNPGHSIDTGIYFHNKSPYYKKTVLENADLIRRAEEMRRIIINFGDYGQ